jgi:hypothetical protein
VTPPTPHVSPRPLVAHFGTLDQLWFGTPLGDWLHPRRNKDGSERDQDRQKVYNCEQKVFGLLCEKNVCDAPDFVSTLTFHPEFQRVYGTGWRFDISETGPKVDYATGQNRGYRRARIQLPSWANNPPMICHEMAHGICPSRVAHGRLFRKVYLDLLSLVGLDNNLSEAFSDAGLMQYPFGK